MSNQFQRPIVTTTNTSHEKNYNWWCLRVFEHAQNLGYKSASDVHDAERITNLIYHEGYQGRNPSARIRTSTIYLMYILGKKIAYGKIGLDHVRQQKRKTRKRTARTTATPAIKEVNMSNLHSMVDLYKTMNNQERKFFQSLIQMVEQ